MPEWPQMNSNPQFTFIFLAPVESGFAHFVTFPAFFAVRYNQLNAVQ